MNYKDLLRFLAEGRNLSQPEEPISGNRLQAITAQVVRSLKPVRPLPPDRTLVSIGLLSFIAFCLGIASIVGFRGYENLSLSQRLTYFSLLVGLAFLFSIVTVQDMIPGSRRRVRPSSAIALMLLLVIALPFALFHDVSLVRFVPLGIPCLRFGCICALLFGALASIPVRKGFLVSPLQTSIAVGLFAGLAGFSALALSCPIQNAAHVVVWHGGAVLAGGLGGAIAGLIRKRIS